MINTLLIIWSLLASVAVLVMGLVLALSPYGETWAGVLFASLALGVGAVSIQVWRERRGWTRPRPVVRPTHTRRAVSRRGRESEPRARSNRTAKDEWGVGSSERESLA